MLGYPYFENLSERKFGSGRGASGESLEFERLLTRGENIINAAPLVGRMFSPEFEG